MKKSEEMEMQKTNPCILLKTQIQNQFGDIRLRVELVPKTCWFSNVRKNVKRSEWDRLRKASYEKANYICEVCGGHGDRHAVECHEIWEYDDDRYIQILKGLISLCPSCHETKHIGLAGLHGRGEIAKNHLSKTNNWTSEQTEQYLKFTKKIWLERSKHEWKLDFDWLENQGVNVELKNE